MTPDHDPSPWPSFVVGAAALVGLFVLAITALTGCPARPPVVGCEPNATTCRDGRPAVCSPQGRFYDTAPEPCPEGSTCCLSASPDGPPIHACVAPAGCVPEEMARVAEPGTATAEEPRDPWGEDGGTQ